MKIFLRILGGVVGAVAALLLVVFIYGRFSDGPVGFFSGGPVTSGERVTMPVPDWSFATDVQTIDFQLIEPPRSRTVWIVVEDGTAYIPCGVPNFTLWKKWPHEALRDGRALLRIDGKLYPRQLVKVDDMTLVASLLKKVGDKYSLSPGAEDPDPGAGDPDPDAVWFFRLDPRAS